MLELEVRKQNKERELRDQQLVRQLENAVEEAKSAFRAHRSSEAGENSAPVGQENCNAAEPEPCSEQAPVTSQVPSQQPIAPENVVLHQDFNNTRNVGREARAEPGAIPVFRHLVGSPVDRPVFIDDSSEWSGYKLAMEIYLASKGAFSAEAQTMHLMGSLSGFARDELMRCYDDQQGGWFDLNQLWVQIDQYFRQGRTLEFKDHAEAWMDKYPWDGNEWSINNFCSQVSQRFANLLGRAQPGLSAIIAKTILARGLPSKLVHELNRKMRYEPEWKNINGDVDLLCRAVHDIFREFNSSGMQIPWVQSQKLFKSDPRQMSDDEDGPDDRYRQQEDDRRPVEEDKRKHDSGKALHPNAITQDPRSVSPKDPAYRSLTCYFCGEQGHFERFCLKKKAIIQRESKLENRIFEGQMNSVEPDRDMGYVSRYGPGFRSGKNCLKE